MDRYLVLARSAAVESFHTLGLARLANAANHDIANDKIEGSHCSDGNGHQCAFTRPVLNAAYLDG